MDPAAALRQIALHLERSAAPTYRVRAFRRAADVVADLPADDLARHVADGTLTALPGIGEATAGVVIDAVEGREPAYLARVLGEDSALPDGGALRDALRGDCHTHSDWSDGAATIEEMAEAARALGHEYLVLTDHSPRLTVARGLSERRLRDQLAVLADLRARIAPFRVLSGIEVDILADGTLDQDPDLMAELDVVVASAHSKLRMPEQEMTQRLLTAVANPLVTVLGHCTGRLLTRRGRPESEFDARAVFTACRDHDVAVEINSRPERLDPPRRLLRTAREIGCRFAVDSDAHAPGQLGWLPYGCARALECGIDPSDVINTLPADDLIAWSRSR
ncbi:PHP domain-containing protein [Saccharomonospora saliphila]|uniref:PHP domain-containing protein n=1 Tax=Saccharomonospora saliphila TaxID=369829 RepID=UPI000382E2F8|nr:PHP domain-containing protein [Saccharomonospora saliphila]